jgi:hypothetical protein
MCLANMQSNQHINSESGVTFARASPDIGMGHARAFVCRWQQHN